MLQVFRHKYISSAPQPRHAHAETTITMVLAGTIRERVGNAEEIARPFSYVIKPCDTEHANEFSEHVRTLQIVIPQGEIPHFEHATPSLYRWRWNHTGAAVPAFMTLLSTLDKGQIDSAATELIAVLSSEQETRSGKPPLWIRRVRESIDDDRVVLSVSSLAAAAGVHRVYLARQFREWYGCSITEYSRRLRARRAAEIIAEASGTLSCAAYETGFSDHSHMCRVFKRETGVSPASFRAMIES